MPAVTLLLAAEKYSPPATYFNDEVLPGCDVTESLEAAAARAAFSSATFIP